MLLSNCTQAPAVESVVVAPVGNIAADVVAAGCGIAVGRTAEPCTAGASFAVCAQAACIRTAGAPPD